MAQNSVNKLQFVAEVAANVEAAGNLGNNVPTADLAGDAVIAATAGSFEALRAGTAAAVGAWVFLEAGTEEPVYLVTAKPLA